MPDTAAPPAVDPADLKDPAGAAASNGGEPAQEPQEPPQEPPATEPDPEGEPDPAADTEPEIVLEGTGQLSMQVGGKKPTSSELKLQGGSIGLEGQFSKGETIVLRVE